MSISPEIPQANSSAHEEASRESSTLEKAPSRVLREIGSRQDITNTVDLVAFYNAAEDEKTRSVLRHWLRGYVEHFREHTANGFNAASYEAYSRLADVEPSDGEDLDLVHGVFSSLADRARQRRVGERGCLEALSYVLRSVNTAVFRGDTVELFELASSLLSQLVQGSVPFTRSTCPAHWEKLSAVHQIFVLVSKIAPKEMPCGRCNGAAFHSLKNQIRRITRSQSHFPLLFAAKLVEQSLMRLVTDDASFFHDGLRRLAYGFRGLLYGYSALRKLFVADIDPEPIEKVWKSFKAAREGDGVRKESWYDRLMELVRVGSLTGRSTEDPDEFVECLENLMRDQRTAWKGEEKKLLRFGILEQLRESALRSAVEKIRCLSAEELMEIGTRGVLCDGWGDDRDVFGAVVKALTDVHAVGEYRAKTEPALAMLAVSENVKHKDVVAACLRGFIANGIKTKTPIPKTSVLCLVRLVYLKTVCSVS